VAVTGDRARQRWVGRNLSYVEGQNVMDPFPYDLDGDRLPKKQPMIG
jgi:hypothetical protein